MEGRGSVNAGFGHQGLGAVRVPAYPPPVESFCDTHAHLDFPDFSGDIDAVLERARAAGIDRIVTIGCDVESSLRAIALAERHPGVFAAVGWHPGYVMAAPEDVRPWLRDIAKHPRVVAIGECGIDHYRLPSAESGGTPEDDERMKAQQERIFRQQLEVAAEVGLNVVVHQRAAHRAAMDIFRPFADRVRGVFHCFVGTVAEMEEVVGVGSFVSFTGIMTFKNAAEVRTTLAAAPADRILFETDCPYLAPVPYRGKRAEPAYVRDIALKAAEVRGVSVAALAEQVALNTAAFFPRMR
jgi:TatD DNase family protein